MDKLIGCFFGRWKVICVAEPSVFKSKKNVPRYLCKCECGKERAVLYSSLKSGRSKSCGCLNREVSKDKNTSHGGSYSDEYVAWQSMRQRVLNKNNRRHSAYSGRGIYICDRWNDFSLFLNDMGRKPSKMHSVDRINNDDGYHPGNCRWAIPKEQMRNRSVTFYVDYHGEKIPLAELAEKYEIPANTLRARILKGWDLEEALTKPVRVKNPNGAGRRSRSKQKHTQP